MRCISDSSCPPLREGQWFTNRLKSSLPTFTVTLRISRVFGSVTLSNITGIGLLPITATLLESKINATSIPRSSGPSNHTYLYPLSFKKDVFTKSFNTVPFSTSINPTTAGKFVPLFVMASTVWFRCS